MQNASQQGREAFCSLEPGFPCMKRRAFREATACTLAAISAHGGNLGVQMAQEGPCTHGAEEGLGSMIQFIRRATEGNQH